MRDLAVAVAEVTILVLLPCKILSGYFSTITFHHSTSSPLSNGTLQEASLDTCITLMDNLKEKEVS